MKRLRTIASILFLTLFGIMNLHKVVPHIHHHEDEHVVAHHHGHNHPHHDHDKENDEDKGLDDILILLLTDHAHSFQAYESDTELRKTQSLNEQIQFDVVEESEGINYSGLADSHRYYLFKPRLDHSAKFSSRSLRAPPELG